MTIAELKNKFNTELEVLDNRLPWQKKEDCETVAEKMQRIDYKGYWEAFEIFAKDNSGSVVL